MMIPEDILDLARGLKARGESFAMATVVRTVAATAAKAGAKAVIAPGGAISGGWIGGGCARAAVLKAAMAALRDGQPRLISVQPEDVLASQGLRPGDARDGVQFAHNGCPSRGSMDIFIEPFLPLPHVVIAGASPVAVALAELAARMSFFVTVAAPAAEHAKFPTAAGRVDGYALPASGNPIGYVIVATQGSGDTAALTAALRTDAPYVAFVGSRKKVAVLKAALAESGIPADRLATLRAPAGLDLGAITPDEIAFSIVAEMIELRRHGHRHAADPAPSP